MFVLSKSFRNKQKAKDRPAKYKYPYRNINSSSKNPGRPKPNIPSTIIYSLYA